MRERGKVKWFSEEKNYGFIERDGDEDVFVHKSDFTGSGPVLSGGDEVEFDVVTGPKGPKATNVIRPPFVNPYSFVRWLPEGDPEGHPLLGRHPPPPHDRYLGLTGRLSCNLLAVTPTFVSDSEHVQWEGEGKHGIYRCFRDGRGSPAVPASTLRGVIRTVFEAATNSCFLLMERNKRYGEKHDRGTAKAGEMVPPHLQPCSEGDALCPACRVFGWVRPEQESGKKEGDGRGVEAAYRGRVRFYPASFEESDLEEGSWTLPPLMKPRPSYARFYLMTKKGEPFKEDSNDQQAGYAGPNRVRGRKLYWYEDRRAPPTTKDRSERNRTIRDWLRPEAQADWEIRFENLAPVELGALLWSLTLQTEDTEVAAVHRLGLGKPLGLGSVLIRLKTVELLDPRRYEGATDSQWRGLEPEHALRFRRAMVDRFGSGQPAGRFSNLRNVRDLLSILDRRRERPDEVCYPPDGYEWFNQNDKAAKHLSLPMPDADDQALPRKP